jgi:hypothetical protein
MKRETKTENPRSERFGRRTGDGFRDERIP